MCRNCFAWKGDVMHKDITVEDAMHIPDACYIDVRSPQEYQEAHIPGALNIPLFTDDERAVVGTIYKQQSPDLAKAEALKIVSPKLSSLVEQCQSLSLQRPLMLYCWRGGMRSKSVATILDLMSVPAMRLLGGFKAYRKYVNNYFAEPLTHKFVVIHGLTGVGKTEVIQRLPQIGVAAIDLEGLANNRGSVFGNVGMTGQPSQKMFEGVLAGQLMELKDQGYVVVEGESKRIGRLFLPDSVFDAMNKGRTILLYSPIEKRIERINRIYTEGPDQNIEELIKAVQALSKRLGHAKVNELVEMIYRKQFDEAVKILLIDYYDPLYKYPDHPSEKYDISIDGADPIQAADAIKEFINAELLTRR